MPAKRSSSLLRVCVIVGVLALVAEGALAQFITRPVPRAVQSPTQAAGVGVTYPGWTPTDVWGVRYWTARPPAILSPATATQTTTVAQGQTAINNTNVVVVQPPSYGYYGGYPYSYPGYGRRATYTYYDRGLFNGMMGPFGLSSLQPLRVTTLP